MAATHHTSAFQSSGSANPYGGPNPSEMLPTEKQMRYARQIAQSRRLVLPWDAQQNRRDLSRWIDAQLNGNPRVSQAQPASSRQVGFAERIARIKGRRVPDECFRSRQLMSKWIESNK